MTGTIETFSEAQPAAPSPAATRHNTAGSSDTARFMVVPLFGSDNS
jgi:hypothetical protein